MTLFMLMMLAWLFVGALAAFAWGSFARLGDGPDDVQTQPAREVREVREVRHLRRYTA